MCSGVDFVAVKASQFNKLKLREDYSGLHQESTELLISRLNVRFLPRSLYFAITYKPFSNDSPGSFRRIGALTLAAGQSVWTSRCIGMLFV